MESNDIETQAEEWLVEIKTATPARLKQLWPAFHAWMSADPRHREAYLRLEAAWPVGHKRMRSRRPERYKMIGAAVAAALVVLWVRPTQLSPAHPYETSYGEYKSIRLRDGSVVELNTNTHVSVKMTARERVITLDRGEALFTVAANNDRPFKVRVDNDTLVALGTVFGARKDADGNASAYVREGTVKVLAGKIDPMFGGAQAPSYMKAGDLVRLGTERAQPVDVGLPAVEQRLAWQSGKIDIDGSLADAVNEFNRYNTRRLELADQTIAGTHIQGIFKATDPEAFARVVASHFGIRVWILTATDSKEGVIQLGGNH